MKKILLVIAMLCCIFLGAVGYRYLIEKRNTVNDCQSLKKEADSLQVELKKAYDTINEMRECCETLNSYSPNNEEVIGLNNVLNEIKTNAVVSYAIPLSVLFKENSVELDATSKEIIRNVAILIKNNNTSTYTLYGFGDNTGSETYNQVLSEARCESVKKELLKYGVPEDKIQIVGMGKTSSFGDKTSYVNQRVTFVKNF